VATGGDALNGPAFVGPALVGPAFLGPAFVGLVPAAGRARRIAPLPLSKELYPVGFREVQGSPRPVPACEHLLGAMAAAGATTVYVVLADGKWDIPAYLGDGSELGLDIAYLTMRHSPGVPFTVDRAHAHVRDSTVAFGFPDIVFTPADALLRLRARRDAGGADIVLGLFPTDRPEAADLVDADARGRVRRVLVKPTGSPLRLAWALAVWGPAFSEHLHAWIGSDKAAATSGPLPVELQLGHVVQSAVDSGLRVEAEVLDGTFTDIGTPEGLRAAVRASM